MKNILFYFYKILPEKIIKQDNYYCFYFGDYKYFFYLVDKPLNYINELVSFLKIVNNNFMMIIFNVNNEPVSNFNNKYYILLKMNKDKLFSLDDIYNPCYCPNEAYNFILLNHSDWYKLFCSKIDYFEYQKDYIKMKYKTLYNTIEYFIGLGENAISYFNAVNSYIAKDFNDRLVVSRRRVNLKDFSFYNPLNIVIDNKARDSAEYLKYLFINDSYTYEFVDEFLSNLNYSTYQYSLLMVRLLFPNYYFDIYEKIVNGIVKEKEIIKIIVRVDEYEKFLKYIYNFIKKKKPILNIDWLD